MVSFKRLAPTVTRATAATPPVRALHLAAAVIAAATSMFSGSQANAAFCAGPGYNASQLLDAANNVILEWSVCGVGIDFQLSANGTGWIGLAWGVVPFGGGDAVKGNVVGGIPTVQDAHFTGFFGFGHTPATADTVQNLSDTGGSESAGVTTIRFSRLLDTGDAAEDVILSVAGGSATEFTWMLNANSDDFLATTSGSFPELTGIGTVSVFLSEGGAHRSVSEPVTAVLFAAGLAGFGALRRRKTR